MNILSFERPTSAWLWALWHLGMGLALTAVPAQLMFGQALPAMPAAKMPFLLGFAGVYALAAVLVFALTTGGRRIGLGMLLLILTAAIGGWGLLLLLTKVELTRPLLLLLAALAGVSLLLSLCLPRTWQIAGGTLALLLSLGLQSAGERPRELLVKALDLGPKPSRTQAVINSSAYSIQATFFDGYFNRCATPRAPVVRSRPSRRVFCTRPVMASCTSSRTSPARPCRRDGSTRWCRSTTPTFSPVARMSATSACFA